MNLFSPKERDAVEDKYCDTPVYEMAEDVCSRCLAGCRTFALHASELLYLAFYIIDTIRGSDPKRARRFADRCYDDNMNYLRHDKQTGASDEDLHTVVTVTLHTAVQWMLDSGHGEWMWVARSLEQQIVERHGEGLVELALSFGECAYREDEEERHQFMQHYMEDMTLISQEIDDLLDALANVAANNDDGKKIYNVQGDFVMQKHVEYEVNGVASGGVGVRVGACN